MIYIFLVVFLYLFFGAVLYFFQRKILFNKSSRPRRPEDYGLENINEITIKTDDNVNLLALNYKGKKIDQLWYIFMIILLILVKWRIVSKNTMIQAFQL